MRILIVTQWFDPEPTLKGLVFAKALQARGHEVEVLTGFPNYPKGKLYPGYQITWIQRENVDGVSVIRVPLYPNHNQSAFMRAMNYMSFALSAALVGPFAVKKADVAYVYHPPATIGLPALALRFLRGIPFVLDIQDLWPDTLAATGMLKSPAALATVAWLCRRIYRRAGHLVVLSPGFKRQLEARGVPSDHIDVIPNWCDEVQLQASVLPPVEAAQLEGKVNIVFAGNIGRAQALDVLLKAAPGIPPGVQIVVVGAGVERERLVLEASQAGLSNLLFLPARPAAEIGAILMAADALLVHLKDDPLFEITIPSKIQAYLAAGKPVLAGVRGDAAQMVVDAGAGFTFAPEDPEDLVRAIRDFLALTPEARRALGTAGAAYYCNRLSLDTGIERFEDVFTRVSAGV